LISSMHLALNSEIKTRSITKDQTDSGPSQLDLVFRLR
jgi:hypothetical protein